MKVGIVIVTYNISSEIFLLQMDAIKKFCKDDYEVNIIDNSTDMGVANDIKYHAENLFLKGVLSISYFKTYSSSVNSSDSHAFSANFAYQKLKGNYDYFHFMDHDLIPVMPYSVVEILNGGHVIAGLGQMGSSTKTYFWPGCVMFHLEGDEKDIIDFSPSTGLDTGGGLHLVVEKHGKDHCIFFNEAYHQNQYFNSPIYNSFAMINNGMFMHFVNGSNWAGKDRHEERLNSLLNIAREKINAYED